MDETLRRTMQLQFRCSQLVLSTKIPKISEQIVASMQSANLSRNSVSFIRYWTSWYTQDYWVGRGGVVWWSVGLFQDRIKIKKSIVKVKRRISRNIKDGCDLVYHEPSCIGDLCFPVADSPEKVLDRSS